VTLQWTAAAIRHLYALHSYIMDKNAPAAAEVVAKITSAVDYLRANPSMGRSGRIDGTRELVIPRTPYVVAYVVRPDAIRILAVLHGKQQWPTVFVEDMPPNTPQVN
jgi:toxin ParE1/3/4